MNDFTLLFLVTALACGCHDSATETHDVGASGGGGSLDVGGGGSSDLPLGRVFETTPDRGAPVERPLHGLPPEAMTLDGALFRMRSCVGQDCFVDVEGLARADADGNFLYDAALTRPQPMDPAAEVNAYYHLERFSARFAELGFPTPAQPIHVVVGFQYDFDGDGAVDDFFAGATDVLGAPGILMGIVGSRNLAYDPDVFGHELMHIYQAYGTEALDPFLSSTGLNAVGRAVGEGTADYYSCSVLGDPDVGEYSAAGIGAPFLSSVANNATCPDDLVGESHHDGQILSGALWEIRQQVGAERTDAAVRDVLTMLEPGATWSGLAELLRERLEVTPRESEAIDAVLARRGLPTCSPLVTITAGEAREVWLISNDELFDPATQRLLAWTQYPAGIQLAVTVPAGSTTLTLTVTPLEGQELEGVTLHVRAGAPVDWQAQEGAITVTADASFPASAPAILDADSGTTYYLSLAVAGDVDGFVAVLATVE